MAFEFNATVGRKIIETVFESIGVYHTRQLAEDDIDFDQLYLDTSPIDEDIEFYNGVSKLVIYSPAFSEQAVIKIPFNGYYEEGEPNEYPEWLEFVSADCENGWNYCEAEYNKYKQLQKENISCFVAKTLPFITIFGVTCFIQEFVKPIGTCFQEKAYSFESTTKAKTLIKEKRIAINSNWVTACIEFYGLEKTSQFFEYADKVDRAILRDAHCENYGYRLNGTPCLLDYSDFES